MSLSPAPLNPSTTSPPMEQLAALLREVAQAEIVPPFGRIDARTKDDGSLITTVDLAVQRRLIDALTAMAPGIPVLGEEMTPAQQRLLIEQSASGADDRARGDGAFWALDPLDGTSNYACGFPYFGVSLALLRSGRVELGLVYDPMRDECFSAQLGLGAQLNGAPLVCPIGPERLADAMALIDFKRIPPARIPPLLSAGAFRSQRNLGSVALDWCWLAAGRAQVYLHGGQRLWDYAAGRLIAAEAGVSTRLLPAGLTTSGEQLTLAPQLALAAAHPALFEQWWAHVGLPWMEE